MKNLIVFKGVVEMDGDKKNLQKKVFILEYGMQPREMILPVHLLNGLGTYKGGPNWGERGNGTLLTSLGILREVFSDGVAFAFRNDFMGFLAEDLKPNFPFDLTAEQVMGIVIKFDGAIQRTTR